MIKYNRMKHYHIWISYTTSLFLLCIVFIFLVWIANPIIAQGSKQLVTAPLPSFLSMAQNNQVTTLDIWLPLSSSMIQSSTKKPEIEAKSAFVYDLTTDKTLFAKNPKDKLPMASLTKIMTAIVALENRRSDDKYIVSKEDLVGEDSMGLSEGESMSLKDLLYGLLLPSGNDAAEVLASNYPLGREHFIKALNQKAKSLGLTDTHFTNPTGLEGDGNQYTTAYDLLVITRYALSNFPLFRHIVATPYYTIDYTKTHKAFYLENQTNLLTTYSGVKGVKTGYTPEADLCLVTYLDYGGHQIIGILLGSNNRRLEMQELLDYSLKVLGVTPLPHS